jgi:hypothetical protein
MDEDGEDRLVKNRQDPNANSSLAMVFVFYLIYLYKLTAYNFIRDQYF